MGPPNRHTGQRGFEWMWLPKGCTLSMGFTRWFIPAMVYVVFDGSSTICSKSRFQILQILSIQIGMTIPNARIRLTNARLVFSVFKIVVFSLCGQMYPLDPCGILHRWASHMVC